MILYVGDPVRLTHNWGSFQGMRGTIRGLQGDRVLVLLEGDTSPTLFFRDEVARDEPSTTNLTGAE